MTAKIVTREGINLNTVLLTIVTALSGWTLKTVHELERTQARNEARVDHLFLQANNFEERLTVTAKELTQHRIDIHGSTKSNQ